MRFHFAGMNTLADPASIDCFNGKSKQYGQCIDICNCDLDDENNAIRRDGFNLVVAGDISSCWTSKDNVTYCVSGGHLCTFNGVTVTTLTTVFTVSSVCEFEQVNDVVVFSDNEKIGIIDGATVTRIDKASDWVDVASLEAWVASHYPADPANWNGVASNSNFEIDAFKLATLAGKCLHHFGGTLYLAIDNFVYATKTYNIEQMDIRYNVVAGFPDPVTMIHHVSNGLFVGTTKATYFLEGGGIVVDEAGKLQAGFSQVQVAPYGAIYGTDVQIHAGLIPQLQAVGMAVLWTTKMGIFAGLPGGTAINLSADKITLYPSVYGTAIHKVINDTNQYIVCLDATSTWVLNLANLTHSRFENYGFSSLFNIDSECFGVNSSGIFRFEGDTDYAPSLPQKIDAFVLTPSTDFGKKEAKGLPALYVQARCSGELAVDYFINEKPIYEDDVILFDDLASAHTLRTAPPRGIRGTFWQIKLKNVNGAAFTALNIEPAVAVSAGRTR
jgi:hypothetical protein